MTENLIAGVMVFIGLFLIGGVFSLFRQGLKIGAAICALGAAMAITAGVLWW
jgi:cbb3-type cytochrome oxidase subunit 3